MDECSAAYSVLIHFRGALSHMDPKSRAYLTAMARDILDETPPAQKHPSDEAEPARLFAHLVGELARRAAEREARNERDSLLRKALQAIAAGSEDDATDRFAVKQALAALRDRHADWYAAFALREQAGFAHDEVAAELHIGNGAARHRVSLAKRFLREKLGGEA